MFGATLILPVSGFSEEELVSMLGEKRSETLKSDDYVVFTVVLYNADAHQDWVHSFLSLRACIEVLKKRFPQLQSLSIRSDGAGNFKCASCVLAMIQLSVFACVTIVELSISEAGGGEDITDSFFHTQKLLLAEHVKKKDGSARNVAECVETIALGEREVGAEGSCITLAMSCDRPSKVDGAKKGTFSGISSLYHFKFGHSEEGFTGMRVFAHADIGPGKFYSAQVCKDMWTEDGGLSVGLCGELKEAA